MHESHLHIDDLFIFHSTCFNSLSEIARAKKWCIKYFYLFLCSFCSACENISWGSHSFIYFCKVINSNYVHQLKWWSESSFTGEMNELSWKWKLARKSERKSLNGAVQFAFCSRVIKKFRYLKIPLNIVERQKMNKIRVRFRYLSVSDCVYVISSY